MLRIFIAGRYGVLGLRFGSVPRTRVGPLSRHGFTEADTAIGCSISGLGTPRYPLRTRRPRRIRFQAACPAWTASFPWFSFLLPAARPHERHRLFRRCAYGSASCPFNPFRTSPDPSRYEPRCSRPSLEGGEQPLHHVWLLPCLQVVLRYSSIRRVVRTCVRPLDATQLRCGPLWRSRLQVRISPEDSRFTAVATWFSRSCHCDQLLLKRFRNSPLSASDETPSANSVPGSLSGVDRQLSLVFIPPSSREAA